MCPQSAKQRPWAGGGACIWPSATLTTSNRQSHLQLQDEPQPIKKNVIGAFREAGGGSRNSDRALYPPASSRRGCGKHLCSEMGQDSQIWLDPKKTFRKSGSSGSVIVKVWGRMGVALKCVAERRE